MEPIVSSSTALAFLTDMSEKQKSTSLGAIQAKNRWKTSSIEEKLDLLCRHVKGERIVDICHNVRLCYCSIHTIYDTAKGIKESPK